MKSHRSRGRGLLAPLTISAIALLSAVSATLVTQPPASAHSNRVGTAVDPVLYSQNDHDTHVGVFSERFLRGWRDHNSRGADDFTVPSTGWKVTEIDVTGQDFEDAPAGTENVAFFAGAGDAPGAVVARFPDVSGTDNGTGSLQIPLDPPIQLTQGTYWVSVQAGIDRDWWLWQTTKRTHGSPAVWKNPRDGFGTGCTVFTPLQMCNRKEGPDFMFLLRGTSES